MCGRYSITSPVEALRRMFGFQALPNLAPNYNVAPTNAVPIVHNDMGQSVLDFARWGLIPSWAKEIGSKPLINARAETVEEKPSFRAPFKRRRCLVPADGFYEWQKQPSGFKQPYYMHPAKGGPFAMGGIWDEWAAPDGSEINSLAIITTPSNQSLRALHHRLPLVIEETDFDIWLEEDPEDWNLVRGLLRPAADDFFSAHPVSARVNSITNDDPELIEPTKVDEKDKSKKTNPDQLNLFDK